MLNEKMNANENFYKNGKINLLFPNGEFDAKTGEENFRTISDVTFHDLGIDFICEKLTEKNEEQIYFRQILSKMTDDAEIAEYRIGIFDDIFQNPEMSKNLLSQLEQIDYEKRFSGFSGRYEESNSAWELLHRLEQIANYIKSVEAIHSCLSGYDLKSDGMKNLKNHIEKIYNENGFAELKKDISELKATTQNLKSVTLGVNLNEKFEAHGIGVVSFNKKTFTKSAVIGDFVSKVAKTETLNEKNWNENYKFHQIEDGKEELFSKLIGIAGLSDPRAQTSPFYMDKIANSMIGSIVHKLNQTLKKYIYLPVTEITELIPQFVFFIRFAEYIKRMQAEGFKFCKPEIAKGEPKYFMSAKGVYNFKLLSAFENKADFQSENRLQDENVFQNTNESQKESGRKTESKRENADNRIVANDLDFDKNHLVYILTGANRGGKTTFTQAIGLLFVLAQAGLYVPGESFVFNPADSIYTHFPADEDKTMDLGRLGEECKRFKEIYSVATETSLILLNETYSTTSFEEGFYIAKDSVRAILKKGIRTIYNTHMHKLAFDIEEINSSLEQNRSNGSGTEQNFHESANPHEEKRDSKKECKSSGFQSKSGFKASSLVVKTENGERSFKVEIAPPEGVSFAKDIAEKYGVTFEMLTKN